MKQRRDSFHMPWATLVVAVLLAGSLALPGCGGSSSGSTGPSSMPTPAPVRTIVAQEGFSGLQPSDPSADEVEDVAFVFFSTTQTGTLDVTVDWTHASNDVDFVLLRGTLEQLLSPACQEQDLSACPLEIVAVAESLAKPETTSVSNVTAGGYAVLVVNFGTTPESGVIVVGLTS